MPNFTHENNQYCLLFTNFFMQVNAQKSINIVENSTPDINEWFTIKDYYTSYLKSEVGHLQGLAYDQNFIYLAFTHRSVIMDCNANLVGFLDTEYHFGDITIFDGMLYVTQEKGDFNRKGFNDSHVLKINVRNLPQQTNEFNPAILEIVNDFKINETIYGIGGIAFGDNKFMIVGGNDPIKTKNPLIGEASVVNNLYEYDINFEYLNTYTYYTGNTWA